MSNTAKTKICLLGVAILVIAAATVFAQSNSPVPEQPAPVQLDGRTIFYVRPTANSLTPEVRAKNIGERIQRLAADPYSRPDSIKVSDSDISTDIVADDVTITLILDADAQAEGRSRQELAVERAEQIKTAIQQYRREHSTRNFLKASGFALLTTIVFLALLILIQKSYRVSRSRLIAWIEKDPRPLLRKYETPHFQQLEATILGFLKLPRLAAIVVLLYFYIGLVYSFFPGTRNVAGLVLSYTTDPL